MPILLKVFQNIEEEEILSTHFYGDSVTLMPKSDKNTAMKRKKNDGPVSLINIDAKLLNKTPAN